ncbi:NAD(P)-dependent oxidoreductase [Timonella senegalensis]|uniref:NAD(P)-dependent oxidoreductase n=1 Tax=Timonella senegalensis TaxID=1465825 RepID=UPI0002DE14DA|nr:NAD(P)H-binding protein [Timonella senegalensis]
MKIAIYGGTGMVGSRVALEAIGRGHEVTVIGRHQANVEGATLQIGDASDTDEFLQTAREHDAVVISIPPSRTGQSHRPTLELHKNIIENRPAGRTFVVGGAGSLMAGDRHLHETEGFPAAFKPEAETMSTVLDMYKESTGFNWVVLSPAPLIAPGTRTGSYKVGKDSPVGDSISAEDFAVAVVDELENPAHQNTRFTVAN